MNEGLARQPTAAQIERRPTVLFITGWDRSGSTLLSRVLAEIPGVVAVGELHYLWERGVVEGRRCSCGETAPDCPLWGEVLLAVDPRQYGWSGADELAAFIRRAVRIRRTVEFLRARSAEQLDPELERYCRLLGDTYRAIGEASGASVIVDSSKRPSDGALVRLGQRREVRFLHLVRDPRAVAYSGTRAKPQLDVSEAMARRSAGSSAANWLVLNWLSERLGQHVDPAFWRRLRYEDFVRSPATTVSSVANLLDVPLPENPVATDATISMGGGHIISGNPGRFERGSVRIREDTEWRTAQSSLDRVIATVVSSPLLRRYGYPVWPAAIAVSAAEV